MNKIRIEDSEQLFSLFEKVITDFPKESKDKGEIVEDENELKICSSLKIQVKFYKIIFKLLCQFLCRTNKSYILLQKFLISLLANQKSLKTMQGKR